MVKIFPISSYSTAPPIYTSRDRVSRAEHLVGISALVRVLILKVMRPCSDTGLYIWLYSTDKARYLTYLLEWKPGIGETLRAASVMKNVWDSEMCKSVNITIVEAVMRIISL